MLSRPHRRLILLFLLTVLLPCAVMVALSVHVLRQERELAEKRLDEDRVRAIEQIRAALSARLDTVTSRELDALARRTSRSPNLRYSEPAVRLVAPIDRGRVVLPWESADVADARRTLSEGEFGAALQRGEHEEFARRDPALAAATYEEALRAARRPVQAAYARLALARTATKLGRHEDARRLYHAVLESDPDVTDEHGVPMALYAAVPLAKNATRDVNARMTVYAHLPCCLPPAALYLLRDVLETMRVNGAEPDVQVDAAAAARAVGERIRYAEEALALQRDLPGLGLPSGTHASTGGAPRWVLFGMEGWLVSVAASAELKRDVVVAVNARELLEAVGNAAYSPPHPTVHVRRLTNGPIQGATLGPDFSGLVVEFSSSAAPPAAAGTRLARSFYVGTLVVVLSVILFGAYVLGRDVRRELHMAEMRSQFVSSVSHELKTPLTAIRMFAETLLRDRSMAPQARREALDIVVNESERLTRLLNNVLDLSRIERGQKVYHFGSVDLANIVERCAQILRYALAQQGFQLHVQAVGDLPPVTADPDALEQAILNLLTNAIKYSGESRDIELQLLRRDGEAVIRVVDRGIGIPVEAHKRIIEKFYRVPAPENAGIPGTGLGLTLVDHIVRAHRGRLEVASTPGRGSTFAIHLPLDQARST